MADKPSCSSLMLSGMTATRSWLHCQLSYDSSTFQIKLWDQHTHHLDPSMCHICHENTIIYVSYKDQGKLIAEELGCSMYSGGGDHTPHQLQQIWEDWLGGRWSKAMVCMSAFNAGNDYLHVQMVVHAGNPTEMVLYVQETGRGG